jgi:hypothetical protein
MIYPSVLSGEKEVNPKNLFTPPQPISFDQPLNEFLEYIHSSDDSMVFDSQASKCSILSLTVFKLDLLLFLPL